MSTKYVKTTMPHWNQWKAKCAIDLCSELCRENLVEFVGPQLIKRFGKVCRGRQRPSINTEQDGNQARSGFHFFETYMHSVSSATGKRWKDWLFERAIMNVEDSPEVAIEKLVSNCLSTAVLRWMTEGVEDDTSKARGYGVVVSPLDRGFLDDEESTFHDIVEDTSRPDPADEAAIRELQKIAETHASDRFATMEIETRTAVFASAMDISLDNEVIKQVAGKGKSVLYTLVNLPKSEQRIIGRTFCSALWQSFRTEMGREWATEEPRTLDLLADFYAQALGEQATAWGKSEKSLKPLFSDEEALPES